jgi:hypothetical protein
MSHPRTPLVPLVLVSLLPLAVAGAQTPSTWPQHSLERPKPPVEAAPAQRLPVAPPPGAIVLFDGRDLGWWTTGDGAAAPWRGVDGAMEVVPNTGGIRTRAGFGDVRLHIEWASPAPPRGTGQDRGNSGVFFQQTYEVQVLDSYRNDTYADGQAASLYGQFPPRVNVTRPPGEWQSYDIEFRRPRFDSTGVLVAPARMTVRHNGVLVQDDVALLGPTSHRVRAPYAAHADELPIALQDHGHPVRFRNIWVQPLPR